eukprot:Tbor_TRINITY_DN4727_c1_g1::TRINITY_DN4727_c1_g1_i2::g.16884::m.16884
MYTPEVTLASAACRSYSPDRAIPIGGEDFTAVEMEYSQHTGVCNQTSFSPGLLVASTTSSIMFNNKSLSGRKSFTNSPARTNSPMKHSNTTTISSSRMSSASPLLAGSVSKIIKNLSGVNSRTASPNALNRKRECEAHVNAVAALTVPPNGRQQQSALSCDSRCGGMGPIRIPPPGSGGGPVGLTYRASGVERRLCAASPTIIGTTPRTNSTRRSRSGISSHNSPIRRQSPNSKSSMSRNQSSNSLHNTQSLETSRRNSHPTGVVQQRNKSPNIGRKNLQSEESFNEEKSNMREFAPETKRPMSIPRQRVTVKKASTSTSISTTPARESKLLVRNSSSDCLATVTPSQANSTPMKKESDVGVNTSYTASPVTVQKTGTTRNEESYTNRNGRPLTPRNTVRERFVTTPDQSLNTTRTDVRLTSKPRLNSTPNIRKNSGIQSTPTPNKTVNPAMNYQTSSVSTRRAAGNTNGVPPVTPSPMRRTPILPRGPSSRVQSPFLRSNKPITNTSVSTCNPDANHNGSANLTVQYSKKLSPKDVAIDKQSIPASGFKESDCVDIKDRQGTTPLQPLMLKPQLSQEDGELSRFDSSYETIENGAYRGAWMGRQPDQGDVMCSPRNVNEYKPVALHPRGVSPSRAQRWFADFMVKLKEEDLPFDTWKSLPKEKQDSLFFRWRITEAQRLVILSAV